MTRQTLIGLILNYRDAERTHRCVTSVLADGAAGVVIWDNSEDGGVSAEALRLRWQADPRVAIELSTHNLGFAAGVNRGIDTILERWPKAWVMLINNDAVLSTGALQALSQALLSHPEAVIAYPRVDHNGKVIGTIYYQRHFAILSFGRPWPGSFPFPSGCALLIAPERVSMPLFDEDFFMYGEDAMLGWRLGAKRMVHVPQVLVHHEGNASSRNGSAFYEQQIAAGHWRLAKKLARTRAEVFLLLGCRFISLSARALWRALRFRNFIPLRALIQGWRQALAQEKRHDH